MILPQEEKLIAETRYDAQGRWVKPDLSDPTWTHAWGSGADGKLWSRADWNQQEKDEQNWYRNASSSTPEDVRADLSNTWDGLPPVKIQQISRPDATGKEFIPDNSTGDHRIFHLSLIHI